MYEWNKHLITEKATLLDALGKLNELSGQNMVLLVLDKDERMVGTLTDGDIRRALIAGKGTDVSVGEIMHRSFAFLNAGNIDLAKVREIRERKITLVPALNDDGHIAEVYDFTEFHSILPLDAVLMAGGRGERLRPLTLTTPKPLLKIGEKPIIDYNVEELARNGIRHISVTTNYLAEQLDEHFAEPVGGVSVKCVREPEKLGTIGSLALVKDFYHDNILVMNSDLLTTINYEDLFMFHVEENAYMTVAAIPYMVSVPFAIFKSDGTNICGLEEKPTYNYYANAGIYIIRKSALKYIPETVVYDATDLIEDLIADGKKVVYHPINGMWMDIGSPDDFRHAQEIVKNKQLSNL